MHKQTITCRYNSNAFVLSAVYHLAYSASLSSICNMELLYSNSEQTKLLLDYGSC